MGEANIPVWLPDANLLPQCSADDGLQGPQDHLGEAARPARGSIAGTGSFNQMVYFYEMR